jgi:predicted metal-binding membrane protein
MQIASARHRADWRSGIDVWLARHPESGASLIVGAAWLVLAAGAIAGEHGTAHAATTTRAASLPAAVAGGLTGWVTMTVAMMGPAALAAVRHTAVNSLAWRRGRAMLEFSLAYLAVWTLVGVAGLVLTAHATAPRWTALSVTLAAAALWQLTPVKRRALRECHRAGPLPPRGWQAELAAIRFGLRHGCACVSSCWCVMLAMTFAPGGHLLWTLTLTGLLTAERLFERPRRVMRMTALALGLAALVSAAMPAPADGSHVMSQAQDPRPRSVAQAAAAAATTGPFGNDWMTR